MSLNLSFYFNLLFLALSNRKLLLDLFNSLVEIDSISLLIYKPLSQHYLLTFFLWNSIQVVFSSTLVNKIFKVQLPSS